ncbi:hypothetical protein BH11VER1_BH11VER1_05210 [soil metagenome]
MRITLVQHLITIGALAFSAVFSAHAKTPVLTPDKSGYHLFNPTPADQMREMSTDRPDTTESPYTVDAGHYQLELSFFDYRQDREGSLRNESWAFGLVNFKLGLSNKTDLQFVFNSYAEDKSQDGDITDRASGFSDLLLRVKTNLWGNDGGTTALALMPYVKIPTDTGISNGDWEGGLIVPLGIAVNDRVSVGLMAVGGYVRDEESGDSGFEWLHSATIGIELTELLGMYVEFAGLAGAATDYQAFFNTGLTFSMIDNLVFDSGVRIGLNDAAEDFGVFTGMSVRF